MKMRTDTQKDIKNIIIRKYDLSILSSYVQKFDWAIY